MTTHRERLLACLAGQLIDRPPVALWRHFPVDDQTPSALARATLDFQRTYDLDLVKVTPSSSFCLKDWGAMDEWRGATEGTRDYTHRVVQKPQDWERLSLLDPRQGYLGEQLDCLRQIVSALGPETPVLQTIFNPLSQAKNLSGGTALLVHLRRYPEAVHAGLKTITESTRRFLEVAIETKISGIFYAVQHAQYGLLSEDEYNSFGTVYDQPLLEPASSLWLNMLHLHGDQVMFQRFINFPVQVLNWHDRNRPEPAGGLQTFSGAVCGGIG
jgi:uroporphyrinogen decarboxylase